MKESKCSIRTRSPVAAGRPRVSCTGLLLASFSFAAVCHRSWSDRRHPRRCREPAITRWNLSSSNPVNVSDQDLTHNFYFKNLSDEDYFRGSMIKGEGRRILSGVTCKV